MFPQEEQIKMKNNTPNGRKASSERSHKSFKCDRKCTHQGDRICYNEEPDKTIIKKISQESRSTESSDSLETDSIHSGESLYKTFQFDTQDNDPDIEKCMIFWKNILAKNVKPVKCTLLKAKKEEKVKTVKERKVKKEDICEEEDTRKLWLDIYKDLQRRRLDQVKLVKKKACYPCEDYIDEEYEKKQDSEDIKKLNDWKSHQQPTTKLDVKSQIKRTLQVLKASRSSEGVANKSKKESVHKIDEETVTSVTPQSPQETRKIENKVSDVTTSNETPQPQPQPQLQSQSQPQLQTQVTEYKPETEISEKVEINEPEICRKCGCDMGECICDEMEDLGITAECYSFDCTCVSENTKTCPCGCRVEECICGNIDECSCTCGFKECICTQLDDKSAECTCGCGVEECRCEDLYTKSCKCGHEDCTCDMTEILSAYLESLNTPIRVKDTEVKMVSNECQTEDETVHLKSTYCIICGHFNCYCKFDKCISE